MQRPHNKRRNTLYVSRALSKPLTPPFVFSQGSVWRPAVQSLTQESDSQKWLTWNVWLWGHWTLGMSEWITPCNTWHRLFYLPGYCCWHKAMPAACDPRWHRMMRRDMQAFWSSSPERVSGTGEQCCLSGTSLQLQWQSVLSMEQCSLMGQFHKKNGLSKNVFFLLFPPTSVVPLEKCRSPGGVDVISVYIIIQQNAEGLKGICMRCQLIQS